MQKQFIKKPASYYYTFNMNCMKRGRISILKYLIIKIVSFNITTNQYLYTFRSRLFYHYRLLVQDYTHHKTKLYKLPSCSFHL